MVWRVVLVSNHREGCPANSNKLLIILLYNQKCAAQCVVQEKTLGDTSIGDD
jgi:hypothetical protein